MAPSGATSSGKKVVAENISVAAVGKNQIAAQRLLDRAGYK